MTGTKLVAEMVADLASMRNQASLEDLLAVAVYRGVQMHRVLPASATEALTGHYAGTAAGGVELSLSEADAEFLAQTRA